MGVDVEMVGVSLVFKGEEVQCGAFFQSLYCDEKPW